MRIHGTTAIVTGAASGLGAATAAELVRRGASVVGLDLAPAVEAAEPQEGLTLRAVDVTDHEQVVAAVDEAAAGPAPLRIAVSCAGIAPAARLVSRAGGHDPGLFAKVVQVNLVGTFNVMTAAAVAIARQEPLDEHGQRGVVVNTASIAAVEGQVGQVAYSASKGGVLAMGLPAARDLARLGIRVNTIAPGIMQTPMVEAFGSEHLDALASAIPFPHRLGRPEEFADLVAFVVEHDYVNAEVIRMDGALRMA